MIDTSQSIDEVLRDLSGKTIVQTQMSRWSYLFTELRVIVTYIRLLFLPYNQSIYYDYPVFHSFFETDVILSFLFLSSLVTVAFYLLHRSRKDDGLLRIIAFGIFWYFIALSVESSFIPIVDVIFEHRIYLPSMGAFIAISTSLFILAFNIKKRWSKRINILVPVFIVIIIILTSATYLRNSIWRDEISMWSDVIRKSPHSSVGHIELGLEQNSKGNYRDALLTFQKAMRMTDDQHLRYVIYNNIGNTYEGLLNYEKAMHAYKAAIEIKPNDDSAHYNLGRLYFGKEMYNEAEREFRIAISLNPFNLDAKNNLAVTLSAKNKYLKK